MSDVALYSNGLSYYAMIFYAVDVVPFYDRCEINLLFLSYAYVVLWYATLYDACECVT